MSHIETFIKEISVLLHNPSIVTELETLWKSLDTCSIILQSGTRKGQKCGRPCIKDKITCFTHHTLHMCSYKDCNRKCNITDTICEYHKKEEKRIELKNKPYPMIRWIDPYYVIRGTNIIIDIPNQVIRGYKKELQCIAEETEEIKKACAYYQLRFVALPT